MTRDALNNVPDQQVMPEMFIPYTIIGRADELVVLAKGRPEGLMNAVRAQVYAIDKDQPVTDVKTIETMLNEWVYSGPRFNLLLFSIFAALGLVLALLGIYGVISSSVAQRTHEIGIRMALGASFSRVVWMVLGSGMRLVGAGVAAGLLLSLRVGPRAVEAGLEALDFRPIFVCGGLGAGRSGGIVGLFLAGTRGGAHRSDVRVARGVAAEEMVSRTCFAIFGRKVVPLWKGAVTRPGRRLSGSRG